MERLTPEQIAHELFHAAVTSWIKSGPVFMEVIEEENFSEQSICGTYSAGFLDGVEMMRNALCCGRLTTMELLKGAEVLLLKHKGSQDGMS